MRSLEEEGVAAGGADGAGAAGGAGLDSTTGTSFCVCDTPLDLGVESSSNMPFQAASTALRLFRYSWYSSWASQSLSDAGAASRDSDM